MTLERLIAKAQAEIVMFRVSPRDHAAYIAEALRGQGLHRFDAFDRRTLVLDDPEPAPVPADPTIPQDHLF